MGNEMSVDNTPEQNIAEEALFDEVFRDHLSNFISPESIASADFSSLSPEPMIDTCYEQPAVEMPNMSLSNPITFTDLANSSMDFIEEDPDFSSSLGNDVNRECSNMGNEISVDNTTEVNIAEEALIDEDQLVFRDHLSNFLSPLESIASADTCSTLTHCIPAKIEVIEEAPIDQDQAVTDRLSNFLSPPESIASADTCSTLTHCIPAKIEVIEEAPIDQDQAVTDRLSNFLSPPESIASADTCSTLTHCIPAKIEVIEEAPIDQDQAVTEKCVPVDVTVETSAEKRKCVSTDEQPPKKRAKPTDDENPEVAILDKARQRRIKNTTACRNTRAARRQRDHELVLEAEQLEKLNAELKLHVNMLTKEIKAVRKTLVHRLNGSL